MLLLSSPLPPAAAVNSAAPWRECSIGSAISAAPHPGPLPEGEGVYSLPLTAALSVREIVREKSAPVPLS
jgi:hypothetical protein